MCIRDSVMKMLIILNEPAYGNERTYNGLRLALSLAKAEDVELRVFLMGDSVTAAKPAQKTPDGYYNLERMLKGLTPKRIEVGACGTCIDARGMGLASMPSAASASSKDSSLGIRGSKNLVASRVGMTALRMTTVTRTV